MGRQCSKLLWFRYNAKDQIPAPDESQQAVFDQGTEVGELAQQLFPGGMVVAPSIVNPSEVIAATQKAIPSPPILLRSGDKVAENRMRCPL